MRTFAAASLVALVLASGTACDGDKTPGAATSQPTGRTAPPTSASDPSMHTRQVFILRTAEWRSPTNVPKVSTVRVRFSPSGQV